VGKKQLMTINQAAAYAGLTKNALYQAILGRRLALHPITREIGRKMIAKSAVDQYLTRRQGGFGRKKNKRRTKGEGDGE